MNIANKVTVLRIVLIPVFLVFLLTDIGIIGQYTAIALFILAALTDLLDGYLARSKNLVTDFGKIMDAVADKLLVCAALIALVELSMIPSWVVIVIISRDFLLTAFRTLAASKNIIIAADKIGKIKTTFQIIMIVYLMFMFNAPFLVLAGNVLIGLVLLLTIASAVNYIFKNRTVLQLENI